jgi:integrase
MGRRGHGEGSIHQRSDGRWAAVLDLGWEGGKRRRKYVYGKTRREVQQKLAQVQHTHQQGLPLPTERQTVGHFLERWLRDVARMTVRPSTFVRYTELLTLHAIPVIGKRALAKLSPQDLQALYGQKLQEGLSPQTVVHIHRVLHRALRDAVRWNLAARNVCDLVDPPAVTRAEVRPLNLDQTVALLDAIEQDPLEALYVLAITSGMRQGELLALRWSDLDFEAGAVRAQRNVRRIRGMGYVEGDVKSTRSRRGLPLAPMAVTALQRHRARQAEARLRAGRAWEDRGLVFCNAEGRPANASTLSHRFRDLLERNGLPRVRFHDVRHGFASLLLNQLGEHPKVVQELLGHSAIGLTLDTYSHLIPSLKHDAIARLDALLQARRTQQ